MSSVGAIRNAVCMMEAAGDHVVPGGLAAWQLKRVLDYIEGNLDRPIVVADIGSAVRKSESGFHRAFKRSFGVSVHLYVMHRRIEMAKQLMISTSETISTIAATCGMCDQSHLTRLFSRMVGEPPNKWRRARRDAPVPAAQFPLGVPAGQWKRSVTAAQ